MSTLTAAATGRSAADFGLKPGQRCRAANCFYTRTRWYDATGSVIGWGDLSVDDIGRIQKRLRSGEIFFVVDSMTNWLEPSTVTPTSQLLKQGPILITDREIYLVADSTRGYASPIFRSGLAVKVIDPAGVANLAG